MRAVGVFDHQIAALIAFGLGQEQGRREVGADPSTAVGQITDAVVDMIAERMAFFRRVAIEQRRKDRLGQRRRKEQGVLGEAREDHRADLACRRALRRELLALLGEPRLDPGGGLAVLPLRRAQQVAHVRELIGRQN